MPKRNQFLITRARQFRRNPTASEHRLWQAIRNRQCRYKFRRQHPIVRFIADFCCVELRLIIEVDGSIHDHQQARDAQRTAILAAHGYKVIRIPNNVVNNQLNNVIEHINHECETRQQELSGHIC